MIYSNSQEMRTAMREDRKELEGNLREMKAELNSREQALQLQIERILDLTTKKVDATKEEALNEVSRMKDVAKKEARDKIDEVFDDRNFDDFVENVAKERMEPRIKDIVDEKMIVLERRKQAQLNSALDDIQSEENFRVTRGLTFLQANSDIEIDEKQISLLIRAIKRNRIEPNSLISLLGLLLYMKSDAITDFFREDLLDNNRIITDISYYAIMYFSRTDMRQDLSFYKDVINYTEHPFNVFVETTGTLGNRELLLEILNSKDIVDRTFPSYSYLIDLRKRTTDKLTQHIKDLDYTNTYFFTKPSF